MGSRPQPSRHPCPVNPRSSRIARSPWFCASPASRSARPTTLSRGGAVPRVRRAICQTTGSANPLISAIEVVPSLPGSNAAGFRWPAVTSRSVWMNRVILAPALSTRGGGGGTGDLSDQLGKPRGEHAMEPLCPGAEAIITDPERVNNFAARTDADADAVAAREYPIEFDRAGIVHREGRRRRQHLDRFEERFRLPERARHQGLPRTAGPVVCAGFVPQRVQV